MGIRTRAESSITLYDGSQRKLLRQLTSFPAGAPAEEVAPQRDVRVRAATTVKPPIAQYPIVHERLLQPLEEFKSDHCTMVIGHLLHRKEAGHGRLPAGHNQK